MTWTATFTDNGKGVGTLEAVFNEGQLDEWRFPISVDVNRETDLRPLADKIKAIHAQHVINIAKEPPYAAQLTAFESALNGGK